MLLVILFSPWIGCHFSRLGRKRVSVESLNRVRVQEPSRHTPIQGNSREYPPPPGSEVSDFSWHELSKGPTDKVPEPGGLWSANAKASLKKVNSERLTARLGWTVIYFPILRYPASRVSSIFRKIEETLLAEVSPRLTAPQPHSQPFWLESFRLSSVSCVLTYRWSEPTGGWRKCKEKACRRQARLDFRRSLVSGSFSRTAADLSTSFPGLLGGNIGVSIHHLDAETHFSEGFTVQCGHFSSSAVLLQCFIEPQVSINLFIVTHINVIWHYNSATTRSSFQDSFGLCFNK